MKTLKFFWWLFFGEKRCTAWDRPGGVRCGHATLPVRSLCAGPHTFETLAPQLRYNPKGVVWTPTIMLERNVMLDDNRVVVMREEWTATSTGLRIVRTMRDVGEPNRVNPWETVFDYTVRGFIAKRGGRV